MTGRQFEGLRHSRDITIGAAEIKIVEFPKKIGSSGWTRTSNPPVNSRDPKDPSVTTQSDEDHDAQGFATPSIPSLDPDEH